MGILQQRRVQRRFAFAENADAAPDRVHRWYEYTQGFPASLVAEKLREYGIGRDALVLDPFCGSGTTVVEARLQGLRAAGLDANPLMAFVTQAKTNWEVDPDDIAREAEALLMRLPRVARQRGSQESLVIPMKSVNRWYRPEVLPEIVAMRRMLETARDMGPRVLSALRLAYAKALFDSSQVTMCPGITFVKKPRPPLRVTFRRRVNYIIEDVKHIQRQGLQKTPAPRVAVGDARHIRGFVEPDSIDFIFTSPPYPTDIEYTRQTRAELYLLGFIRDLSDVRHIKDSMVRGSPKNIYKHDHNAELVADFKPVQQAAAEIQERVAGKNWGWDYPRMVREYFGDMYLCLKGFLRVLRQEAWALLVVGDQTCKGVKIPVTDALLDIARSMGYAECHSETFRVRRSTTHAMALEENIVALRKGA